MKTGVNQMNYGINVLHRGPPKKLKMKKNLHQQHLANSTLLQIGKDQYSILFSLNMKFF